MENQVAKVNKKTSLITRIEELEAENSNLSQQNNELEEQIIEMNNTINEIHLLLRRFTQR